MKYRKRPVIVDAVQYKYAENTDECEKFCPILTYSETGGMLIPTLEGVHLVSPGDYIIKGVAGEFYPCKPDIFEQTYEAVDHEKTL